MQVYSLKDHSVKVSFKDAVLQGQAKDKGLYFPERIPVLPKKFFEEINSHSKEEIAFKVISPYIENEIDESSLKKIISESINFDFPLVKITDEIYSLELYHGPTQAFKDVGAKFLAGCLGYFYQSLQKKTTVLVATSGDTGGAVANAFHNASGVDVVILYPSGKVSDVQELQLTTLGNNVHALEVNGTFDDCQQLVKQAFADEKLNKEITLTSANSINIARWLPQQFYYFFAYQQWPYKNELPVISVPSGNFGNIAAGLLAFRSGLPVKHFIAACNANDAVTNYLDEGSYHPQTTVATISNAMDVGDPNNFVRILELSRDHASLKKIVSSYSISDNETKKIIKEIYDSKHYILDPHGAVGFTALQKYFFEKPGKGFFLETAHPVKFKDTIENLIDEKITSGAITPLLQKEKRSVKMEVDYKSLEDFLHTLNR